MKKYYIGLKFFKTVNVVAKGVRNYAIEIENAPTTILGCWVINHTIKGKKENEHIKINGSYDINIWYSYDNNSKTDVVSKKNFYEERVRIKIRFSQYRSSKGGALSAIRKPVHRPLRTVCRST